MKDFTIKTSLNSDLKTVECTISTADYEMWLKEEGALFTQLSEKVVHGDSVTTITLSTSWFDICKRYCKNLLVDAQTQSSTTGADLSTDSGRYQAA